jgi:hypothetical protein
VGWRDLGAAEKPVGVGLLTKAAGQVKNLHLTHCFREQAAPTGDLWVGGIWVQPKNLWGWACSRKRRVRSKCVSDTLLSRASRSHRRFVGWRDLGAAEKPVGVGLLTKAAGQVKHLYLTHCLREQASSHRRFVGWRGSGCSRKTCGSGLAHESGGSGQKSVSDTLPSQTDSLPHRLAHMTMADCCSGHFHPPAWPGAA